MNVKEHWIKQIRNAAGENSTLQNCITLVGNKIDLEDNTSRRGPDTVSEKEHEILASELNTLAARTSAKTGANITVAFQELIMRKVLGTIGSSHNTYSRHLRRKTVRGIP